MSKKSKIELYKKYLDQYSKSEIKIYEDKIYENMPESAKINVELQRIKNKIQKSNNISLLVNYKNIIDEIEFTNKNVYLDDKGYEKLKSLIVKLELELDMKIYLLSAIKSAILEIEEENNIENIKEENKRLK